MRGDTSEPFSLDDEAHGKSEPEKKRRKNEDDEDDEPSLRTSLSPAAKLGILVGAGLALLIIGVVVGVVLTSGRSKKASEPAPNISEPTRDAGQTRSKFNQSGLKAIYDEFILNYPESSPSIVPVEAKYLHRWDGWLVKGDLSIYIGQLRFGLRDCITAERAVIARDQMRQSLRQPIGMQKPSPDKKLSAEEINNFVQTSGKYLILINDEQSMKWIEQHFLLD
jgi:hypothetical protein